MTAIKVFQLDRLGHVRGDGAGEGFVWKHADLAVEGARDALEALGLDPLVMQALLAAETRPRCTVHGAGVLMNLRGVNLNPGAEPEDMVSLRLWLTADLVVSVQLRQLRALTDVVEAVERNQGPEGPADLVAQLALRLADRAEPVVAGLNESIDGLEDRALDGSVPPSRAQLAEIRRAAIVLRRYMFPQRDALSTLEIETLPWVRSQDRSRLREATERVTRLAEELDAIRDRAQLVQDQILDQRAEAMNRQMLILSVVAALFLPLGLITGLLGINVGGMPGAETPWAFWAVCAILGVTAAFQLWFFWRIGLVGGKWD